MLYQSRCSCASDLDWVRPDKLRKSIEERLAARERNWFRRQFDKVLVRWLKYNYAYIWKEIASRL